MYNHICYNFQKYAWQGAMLIIAGIILNCIICGSLFRPIKTPEELNQVATETSNDDDRTINTPKIANQSDSCQAPLTTNSGSSRVISNESVTARGTQKSHLKVISVCKEVFQGIQESMDMRLLQDPVFVIYGISCILCMAGNSNCSLFITKHIHTSRGPLHGLLDGRVLSLGIWTFSLSTFCRARKNTLMCKFTKIMYWLF